jgi:hypothetical protein
MPYRSTDLLRLARGDHTDQVRALEDETLGFLAHLDDALDDLARRTLASWARAFGGPDVEGAGGALGALVAAVRAAVRRLLDPLGKRAAGALAKALAPAVKLGAAQGAAFLRAASGRAVGVPRVRVPRDLRREAAAVTGVVGNWRDRALALLGDGQVSRWSHLLHAIGAARSAGAAVRGHGAWVLGRAVNTGLAAVAQAADLARVWVSEANACVRCLAYAGRIAQPGGSFPGGLSWDPKLRVVGAKRIDGPPLHPHCFPAGTVASGPGPRAATDRWYEGEMVEVRTCGGRILTVTPNHPVLTSQGWIAAGLLREGSQVVGDTALESVLSRDPDDYQEPALIEEVAGALRSSSRVLSVRMPVTAEDFHGDGTDCEVDIVWADSLLGDRLQVAQPFSQEELGRADVGLSALTSEGDFRPVLGGLRAATHGSMGGLDIGVMLLRRSSVRQEAIGLYLPARYDSGLFEQSLNDSAGDAFAIRDALDALAALVPFDKAGDLVDHPDADTNALAAQEVVHRLTAHSHAGREGTQALSGLVALDEVIAVRRFPFAGHVYNLETSGGWYIANGIIVHNCRCRAVPWNQQWAADGVPFPLALQREAQRSVAYGRTTGTESRASRVRAAAELLRTQPGLLPAVEARARTAVRTGRFQAAA